MAMTVIATNSPVSFPYALHPACWKQVVSGDDHKCDKFYLITITSIEKFKNGTGGDVGDVDHAGVHELDLINLYRR